MYSQIESNKRRTWVLMLVFVIIVMGLGWLLSVTTDFGYAGLALAGGISLVMTLVSYYSGDKVALRSAGARQVTKQDSPYVYRMVENLAITAGLPMPKVHVIDDHAINAFATGRDPEHASIAVTQGAIDKLENEELEGVIAHELSHVKNYDIRVMMIVIVLVGIVALMADWLIRGRLFAGGRDRDSSVGAVLVVAGLVLAILSPLIAKLIQLAISRKREYLADASGALLTRYPEGLARALEKIGAQTRPLRKASPATEHLYIANPFGSSKNYLRRIFSTHPPIQERVKALRTMGT